MIRNAMIAAALMLAASTDLAAGCPRRMATALAGPLGLALVEIPGPPLRFHMQLLWHERTHADAGSRYFRQFIQEAAGTQERSTPSPRRP